MEGNDTEIEEVEGSDTEIEGVEGSDTEIEEVEGSDTEIEGVEGSDTEIEGDQPSEPVMMMDLNVNNRKDPGSAYFDKVLIMVSSAYHKERATNSSALIDSILYNAHFFLLFALYLVCRYANQISLCQGLLCLALTPLFLYFYINHAPFLFLEEDIKWIERELRLLHAISTDADIVVYHSNDLAAKARKVWGSNTDRSGGPVKGLDATEAEWSDEAKSVVLRARTLVTKFDQLRVGRNSQIHTNRTSFVMIWEKFQQIEELFIQTKRVKQDVTDSIKKVQGINMCKSLERSRSNILRLLDRPLHGDDQLRWVESKSRVIANAAALTSSLVKQKIPGLMGDKFGEQLRSMNLQLQLLHPFLKDIEGIRFESEIEEAWVEEVVELVNEAHVVIDSFLQRPVYRTKWLSDMSNWNATKKLKGEIKCIDARFAELLERKDKYGFKFIRRDSSELVYQSTYQTSDDSSISSVVETMRSYLNQDSDVLGEVLYEVTSLCNQLENMYALVGDAGIVEGRYNSRTTWLGQSELIAQDAERSVQTFMDSGGVWRNHIFKTSAGIKLSREIDRINQTINLFVRCIKAYGIELQEELGSVVGLDEDIRAVVSQLTSNTRGDPVVSIVGIGGVGKTTLAKKIYCHGVVVDHFPCRAWVNATYLDSDDNAFLEDVANQVLKSTDFHRQANQNASLIQQVHDILREKKYLLVVDNMTPKVSWNFLQSRLLPMVSHPGSRILLTSRSNILANSQVSSPPHQLRLRTREESLKLFNQIVHIRSTEKRVAKEILGKCGGLPQSILHIGYLMSGEEHVSTAEELEGVLRFITQNDKPLLKNFTNKLPPHLLKFLSYFTLFPKDFEIPARRLIPLWIAEGLVELPEHNTETSEEVAYKYLSELIDQCMIQVIETKHNGEVKTCSLPYALQQLTPEDMRAQRVTDHLNRSDPTTFRGILSILSFDTREGNKPGEEIGTFLRKGIAGGFFFQLQVLDLERVFRPELPNIIGKLSKLKYLGLRWTYLESLPASIGKLHNLQTLDVKHTYVYSLPSSIWKLQKLRHLYLNQSHGSKLIHHQAGRSLTNLQTLWGVFVDNDSALKDELDELINLRKLGLAFQLDLSEQKAIADGIVKLTHLQSLRVKSIGEMGEPNYLIDMPLSDLKNLATLNLFGKLGPSSRIIDTFPESLTDLTLSATFLSDDPMPKLEKLPNLKVVCFYSNSYTGKKMTCSMLAFPQLVVLKLWKLEQLEDWVVEDNAMRNLRELEIRSCKKLNVPRGLKHLKSLTEFKLTNMPKQFAATIAKTKGQLWDDLVHSPTVIAVNWEDLTDNS